MSRLSFDFLTLGIEPEFTPRVNFGYKRELVVCSTCAFTSWGTEAARWGVCVRHSRADPLLHLRVPRAVLADSLAFTSQTNDQSSELHVYFYF